MSPRASGGHITFRCDTPAIMLQHATARLAAFTPLLRLTSRRAVHPPQMGMPVPYELLVQDPSTAALAGTSSPPAFNELWWAVPLVVFVSILPQLFMLLSAVTQRTITSHRGRRSDSSTELASSEQPTGVVVPVPVPTRDRIKLGYGDY